MTDEEATEFLNDHNWSKFSDAREMVQEAYYRGFCDAVNSKRAEIKKLQQLICFMDRTISSL